MVALIQTDDDLKLASQVAARSFYRFYCGYVHQWRWDPLPHLRLVCEKLEAVERGEITRLMVFMPPRHGKSMTISETFPSWFIGRNPDRRVIVAAYGESLAKKFGRKNRQKLEWYGGELWGITIDPSNSSVTNWTIQGRDGGMIATGRGGAITGEGADLLVIDDPIKNREEAESETIREKIWDEWESTLSTRLHKGGRVIIILTRWHEDDLAGRLLAKEGRVEDGGEWHVLSLPAICEDPVNDPLGREEGQALAPDLGYDEEWAEKKRKQVGSYTWGALYQQSPRPADGNIFKRQWIQFYKKLPDRLDTQIQSWDCSFKDTDGSDYVVGQVWGRKGADFYLIDQVRDRMDLPSTIQAVRAMSAKHPRTYGKLVENKANGPAVVQMLRRQIPGLIEVEPEGGKEVRAYAVQPLFEAGNVWLPDPSIAPWVHDYIEELMAFPNGRHDDQVDATTQALIRLRDYPGANSVASGGRSRAKEINDIAKGGW